MSETIAVLGGGPAGLGAALALGQQHRDVVLFEAGPRLGGLAASLEVGGQRVDIGSHRLHPSTSPHTLRLLRGLLGDDLQKRTRNGRIRLFDRWLGFPLTGSDLVRSLPPTFLARAGASAARAAVRPTSDATFADYVTTGLGAVMGEEFYFPYARKMWGIEPDQIAGEQARRRISAGSPAKLAKKIWSGGNTSAGFDYFYYPAGGFGRLCEALAAECERVGVDIRLEEPVQRLSETPTGYDVESLQSKLPAGTVLSTVPLPILNQALGRPPSLSHLSYRAMIVVYVVVAAAQYTPFDAHYLPGAYTPITRISEPKNYRTPTKNWPDPTDVTVLCAELPCDPSDPIWRASDHDLQQVVAQTLARSGLPAAQIVDTTVLRKRQAYPIYPLDFRAQLEPTLEFLQRQRRLLTFGRQGLFAHDNTHHALDMAWAAASVVNADGTIRGAEWSRFLERFAAHVVSD